MDKYIDLFLRKSGYDDPMIDQPLYFPFDEGFFTVECREKALVILTGAGDAKVLFKKVEELAMELGYKKIIFETKRNPKAWERKYGYKLSGYVMSKELK